MKIISILSLILISFTINAQVPSNRTVYDCNGASKNIYTTLASGKSIIVAHKGVDCSICRNSAPGWQTWAANNIAKVEVWGALTYTFNPSQFNTSNMCTKTSQWVAQYGWTDIFAFPDSNRLWVNGGSPRYYVYSAIDSSIVYQGSSSTTARNMALAQSTVGIKKLDLDNTYKVFLSNGVLSVSNTNDIIRRVSVFSVDGKLIQVKEVNSTATEISISNATRGTYIVLVEDANGKLGSKKINF